MSKNKLTKSKASINITTNFVTAQPKPGDNALILDKSGQTKSFKVKAKDVKGLGAEFCKHD